VNEPDHLDEVAKPLDAGVVEVPGGRKVAWSAWGADGGTPVLTQPHLGVADRPLLSVDVEPFRVANLRMIRVSRAGLGQSTPNPGKTVLTEADDMGRVAASLGLKQDLTVLAECGGSGAGLAFAARWPERVRTLVVLSGAAPLRSMPAKNLTKFLAGLRTSSRFKFFMKVGARVQSRTFLKDPGKALDQGWAQLPEVDKSLVGNPALRAITLAGTTQFFSSPEVVLGEWSLLTGPWSIDWSAIRARVVISHGALDKTMPVAMAHWLATKIPGAELRIDPERGHLMRSQEGVELLVELIGS
jgi:pimeloyl-ACP methyl ester carboxylesterase